MVIHQGVLIATVSVHDVKVWIGTMPVTHKDNLHPIRRPTGLSVTAGIVRNLPQIGAVIVHDEYLGIAITIGYKGDFAFG